MGRELQKRKRRSSRATVTQSNRLKKPLNPLGNSTIAKNWNKKETLSQNYRRLGLAAKLGKATGGTDRTGSNSTGATAAQDPLAVTPAHRRSAIRTVRVERDASGNIVRVLRRENPLNDPLNDVDSGDDDDDGDNDKEGEWNGVEEDEEDGEKGTRVVDLLIEEANRPTVAHKRYQSEQEREWVERLVAKHGDDVAAMVRDGKLNPMQQTAGDIKKRLRLYQANLEIDN